MDWAVQNEDRGWSVPKKLSALKALIVSYWCVCSDVPNGTKLTRVLDCNPFDRSLRFDPTLHFCALLFHLANTAASSLTFRLYFACFCMHAIHILVLPQRKVPLILAELSSRFLSLLRKAMIYSVVVTTPIDHDSAFPTQVRWKGKQRH